MVEEHREDGLLVVVDCNITPNRSPKSGATNGKDIFLFAVEVSLKPGELAFFASHFFDILSVEFLSSSIVEVAEVERCENLLLGVEFYIGILAGLEHRADYSEEQRHDDDHDRGIEDRVDIGVGIQAFLSRLIALHLLEAILLLALRTSLGSLVARVDIATYCANIFLSHSYAARFIRLEILTCTTHQSMSGARQFIRRIASIIPSG